MNKVFADKLLLDLFFHGTHISHAELQLISVKDLLST